MSREIGIRALDYFFELLRPIAVRHPSKQIAITFYGGEPLLNFPLLEVLVKYANEHSPLPIIYNVTTNGTLLRSEKLTRFIVDNEINVSISLDGDRVNNDRNRVFRNGSGSFKRVVANVEQFMTSNPNYGKIAFISVFDPDSDFEAIDDFFGTQRLPVTFVYPVASQNTEYYLKFTRDRIQAVDLPAFSGNSIA